MKLLLAIAAALILQTSSLQSDGPQANLSHLRYKRIISTPQTATGEVCTVLDAAVFAHAANRSLDDLRIFRSTTESAPVPLPFALTENEAQLADPEPATVKNVVVHGDEILFDLIMPHRPYTTVDLKLLARNFIATADVSGSDGRSGAEKFLGTFTLFDLTAQQLSRSTTLALQESSFPQLHIDLKIKTLQGSSFPNLAPSIVQGATVPPSREAQTLYTSVAQSNAFPQQGHRTLINLPIPAHVPVERVSFSLPPDYRKSFLRHVTLTMKINAMWDRDSEESVLGEISQMSLPPRLTAGGKDPIRALTIDAVFGANLRQPVTLQISIDNAGNAPLPLRSVQAQMRQRMVCFAASGPGEYSLRYGDNALHAPVYDYASTTASAPSTALAQVSTEAKLGPEQENPDFVPRLEVRPYIERHSETIWIGLLLAVASLGAVAMRGMKKQGRKGPA